MKKALIIANIIPLAVISVLSASSPITFIAPDGAALDRLGTAVAANDFYYAIGSPRDDDSGSNSGAVYIFSATDNSFLQKLTPPANSAGDEFGAALALDGHDLIVGARFDDDQGSNAGAAYLYDLSSGNLLKKITAPTGAAGDQFGNAVTIKDGRIGIAAWLSDTAGSDAGELWLFNKNDSSSLSITAINAAISDQLGASISLSETSIAAGAPFRDGSATNTGSVYVFSLSGTLEEQFSSPANNTGAIFGTAVSLQKSQLLVGAPDANDEGAAYLYDLSTSQLEQIFISPDPSNNEQFATSVSLNGSQVLIGASMNDTPASNAGQAYLFDLNANLIITFQHPTPASADFLGISVSLTTKGALVGIPQDDDNGSSSGSALFFPIKNEIDDLCLSLNSSRTALTLTWTPLTGISNYQIEASIDLDTWAPYLTSTNLTTHTIPLDLSIPKRFFRVTPQP